MSSTRPHTGCFGLVTSGLPVHWSGTQSGAVEVPPSAIAITQVAVAGVPTAGVTRPVTTGSGFIATGGAVTSSPTGTSTTTLAGS